MTHLSWIDIILPTIVFTATGVVVLSLVEKARKQAIRGEDYTVCAAFAILLVLLGIPLTVLMLYYGTR